MDRNELDLVDGLVGRLLVALAAQVVAGDGPTPPYSVRGLPTR